MSEHAHPQEAEPLEVDDGPREPQLDPEVAARRRAALSHVVQWGDPVLKSRALPVSVFDDVLLAEIDRMGSLMDDALGVGLASNQIGRLRQLLVYKVEPDSPVQALVNPEIEWSSKDEEVFEEGCLSLRGVSVDVERPIHVRVRAQDGRGERILVEASGFEARVIQHEMDHLNGVLILDRASREQRREAMRTLRDQAGDEAA